ncbi:MAG: ROK family protein [Limnochordia bacterium]|jgi:glucokinase
MTVKPAIGIDIGGTTFLVAAVDTDGRMVASQEHETRAADDPQIVLRRIIAAVREVLTEVGWNASDIAGIGMGIPGLHDRERGVVLTSPNLKWHNVPVAAEIGQALSTKVKMDGDVRVAAIGERYFGAAGGCDNFIFITLGTGIGSGIFIDGKLYRGPAGYAGEVGHQTIVENGPQCGCGNYGCVEALAGNGGIVRRALQALAGQSAPILLQEVAGDTAKITPAVLHQAALQGCELSRQVLEDTGRYVGTAMANLVNVLNPEKIIVGGGVARAGEMILGPLRDTVKQRAMGPGAAMVEVISAVLGPRAGVIGAAAMAMYDLD